jgi:hypothetical protein
VVRDILVTSRQGTSQFLGVAVTVKFIIELEVIERAFITALSKVCPPTHSYAKITSYEGLALFQIPDRPDAT